jgi:hypothetical protein
MKLHTLFCLFVLAFALIAEAVPAADPQMRTSTESTEKGQRQCWAVTQSGTRCKRRARPGERYCRQHAASVVPKVTPDRCRSMTQNGERCSEKPTPGSNYCPRHATH